MNKKQQTIGSYNQSSDALAIKFNRQGARVLDIVEMFGYMNKSNPRVFEIGCGNGRDAEEILKRTNRYTGMDISDNLLALARQKNPSGHFVRGDIEYFRIPQGQDIVVAFASLIHVPKESLRKILRQILRSLHVGGIMRLSMKYAATYTEVTKTDEFGTRTYYLYSQSDMAELSKGFVQLKEQLMIIRDQTWLELVYQKAAP